MIIGGFNNMKINFTKKQYKQLLDLVYLGEWTANSSKAGDETNKDYEEMYQYILSFAKSYGYDDLITYEKILDGYFPTNEYEESLQPIIDENDNDVFWNELTGRLAKRDLAKKGEKFQSHDDLLKHLFQIEKTYEIEFEKNGVDNLVIKKNNS